MALYRGYTRVTGGHVRVLLKVSNGLLVFFWLYVMRNMSGPQQKKS